MLVLAVTFLPFSNATAQKVDVKVSSEENSTVIEVKDGKLFLNGKEVAELDDADMPILFKRDGEGSGPMWFFNSEKGFVNGSGRAFYSDDGENKFVYSQSPRAFGFMTKDGEESEWVSGVDADFEFDFEFDGDAGEHVMMFEKMAEGSKLRHELESLELRSGQMNAPDVLHSYSILNDRNDRVFDLYNGNFMKQERETRELAHKIRSTDGDTSDLEAEMDALLAEVFSAKQDAQQERVDKLREQLAELEERLSQRKDDKADIIAKRKNELLGKTSKYEW